MPRVFLTGDTHFGHYNIITHCNRPYVDCHDMNEDMIDKWNSAVKEEDTVYHLGDFCFNGFRLLNGVSFHEELFKRLKGQKHLILGNHDRQVAGRYFNLGWKTVQKLLDVSRPFPFTLCHYALRTWHKSSYGAFHFYGHSHGRLPNYGRSCDVGVDSWKFTPVELEEAVAHINKMYKPRDRED